MMVAGHLSTMHFSLAHWQSMPVWQPDEGEMPDGFSRTFRCGRAAVLLRCSGVLCYAVRPIVRVKMGRRPMVKAAFWSDYHQRWIDEVV